jgi:starch synthase
MDPLRICFVASEVAPFAKTGGLGDVAAALPRALHALGHDVRIFLPLYARIENEWGKPGRAAAGQMLLQPVDNVQDVPVQLGGRTLVFSLFMMPLPASRRPLRSAAAAAASEAGSPAAGAIEAAAERAPAPTVFFVRCPHLYARPGIYTNDQDEHLRFLLLCHAALQSCQRMRFAPHVVHCNDWQTALLPVYLKTLYAWDTLFSQARTVLTLHNLGYQGTFAASILPDTGLYQWAERVLDGADLNAHKINFLKTGLLHADALTTVSPTYAREIQTPAYGYGLHELLQSRRDALVGILNGVDTREWNPRTDKLIPFRFSEKSLWRKEKNKELLLNRLGLRYVKGVPLLGIVSRLAGQKGFDLLHDVLPGVLAERDLRVAVLGSGEVRYEEFFSALQRSFPKKLSFYRGFHDELAHWIEAGADMFLMPSQYEPCGLNQMYSQMYGTVPIVRRTGGLADTVTLWDPESGRGTGVVFEHYTPKAARWALEAALDLYADSSGAAAAATGAQPPDAGDAAHAAAPRVLPGGMPHAAAGQGAWRTLMLNGMAQDFSWQRRAQAYVELYRSLAGLR